MDITLLKKLLDDCLTDSQAYSFAEALPLRDAVKKAAMQLPDGFWEQLLPEENFFVFELLPELADKANPNIVAEAYCSALSHCVADWWGMPGHFNTDAAKRLTEKKGIEQCLVAALNNKEAISYTDGEANSVASRRGWQVSDLAASFLAQIRQEPFDAYQPVEEREKAKQVFVK